MIDSIRQILYISKAVQPISDTELHDIASQARVKNKRNGITGALLFTEDSFIQVIEGDYESIERLLVDIRADKRHRDITILMDRKVRSRDFKNWSMGMIRSSDVKTANDVKEIHSAGKECPDTGDENESFPESQTFLMMKHVYETNNALQQAKGAYTP